MTEDDARPCVLLLDDARHEGIISTIKASEVRYRHVDLAEVDDWTEASASFTHTSIASVVGKLTPPCLINLGSATFGASNREMLETILGKPHLLFVHAEIYSGEFVARHADRRRQLNEPFRRTDEAFINFGNMRIPLGQLAALERGVLALRNTALNVVAYKTLPEVTVAAETFIVESESGLLFRMYIPSGRMWQHELDRLVQMFADYLTKVARVSVRVDNVRTAFGIIYAFYGDKLTDTATNERFNEFAAFVDLCTRDPTLAQDVLTKDGIHYSEAIAIVARYSKEARRLQVDIRQEREARLLAVRHRLESELTDVTDLQLNDILRVVDAAIPEGATALPRLVSAPSISSASLVGVNLGTLSIGKLETVVASQINGSVTLTSEDRQLIQLFDTYAGPAANAFTSALYELKDPSAPVGNRAAARQKIRTFLINVSEKLGDAAIKILQKYVESSLGL